MLSLQDPQAELDESLYSRQLYVLGFEAMKKMSISNVLICGMRGLGAEIAKNLVLAGVKSVTLFDPEPITISDLSTQFFLTTSDIGISRAEATAPRLAELNSYVPIDILRGSLEITRLAAFKVVVLTDASFDLQILVNDFTHSNNIHFLSASTMGLFGQIFTDFGDNFEVTDPDGENPITGLIADIDSEGNVTVMEDTRHGLEDGDYVTFSEIEGIQELNNLSAIKVKVTGPFSFSIGNIKHLEGSYEHGGIFTQVKIPKTLSFKSLRDSMDKPEFLITDFAKSERPSQLHLGMQALHEFNIKHGNLPLPRSKEDAKEFISLVNKINEEKKFLDIVDEKLLTELCYQARGQLSPIISVIGSIAAQEILKAVSGKFTPIFQYMYFDSLESLKDPETLSEKECEPINSRFDGQIAVMGKTFQAVAAEYSIFLAGAGAIGCEMLKNWSMMGIATGKGRVVVTDMDTIEKSNLNRQFLFRPIDVGKLKSEVAAQKILEINSNIKINALGEKIDEESEKIFNHNFFDSVDCVITALDSVVAREYIDRRCVFFRKPLIDSGTLGTKGNSQVVVPYLTESYSSSHDPPEKMFPICTLRNFPNQIEHTIAWGRDLFEGLFKQPADKVNLYLSQPRVLEETLISVNNQKEILSCIKAYLVTEKPLTFKDCIKWARFEFEKHFSNNIKQLLFNFPPDSVTSSGMPFWSGPKRLPNVIDFNYTDPAHLAFIVPAANLHAYNYGLKGETDLNKIIEELKKIEVPEFKPQMGIKIETSENDTESNELDATDHEAELSHIQKSLPPPSSFVGFRLYPAEFEKDDDTNFHIDFVTAASNLRAMNYGIRSVDRLKTKLIAGNIIPAIATTTSLVTGLVCLELYKLMNGMNKIEGFKNGFVNLALPFFGFSEPIASTKLKYNDKEKDRIWDSFDYEGDLTLRELLDKLKQDEGLEVTMLSSGVSLLYASFFPPGKLKDRMDLQITDLIEKVSHKPVDESTRNVVLEICADDLQGNDVELPYISIKLK